MKHTKKMSTGSWLKKGEDIKDGDIITIASECKEVEGQYGTQEICLAKTKDGKEGNVGMNQTSINNLIDAYGENDVNWIGKEVKCWIFKDFKDGKIIYKMYLSHPKAEMTENGFTLPSDGIPVIKDNEDVDVKNIPF